MNKDLLETLRYNFDIAYTSALEFPQHMTESRILVIGGPDAYEGVGEIAREVLVKEDQNFLRLGGVGVFTLRQVSGAVRTL